MKKTHALITLTVGLCTVTWTVAAEKTLARANQPALPVSVAGTPVIEGPGYRIERLKTRSNNSSAVSVPSRVLGRSVVNQTVFCHAGENLLITDIRMNTTGTGIVAQRGCRLRIVDSRIEVGGVALIVESGANVELQNSVLTGRMGSIEAAPNARLAALGASFVGPSTLTGVDFVDRGGNLWGSAP